MEDKRDLSFQVEANQDGQRLDNWLFTCLENKFSRNQVQNWIKEGFVSSLNNPNSNASSFSSKIAKKHIVRTGESYQLRMLRTETRSLKAVDLKLVIIYEDDYFIAIHKPPCLTVHPGPNQQMSEATLTDGLLHLWREKGLWSDAKSDDLRLGLVHRLDRDTEGILLVAKNLIIQEKLMQLFTKQEIQKEYLAWVWGSLSSGDGEIELPIARHPTHRVKMQVKAGGRLATTYYKIERVRNTPRGRKFSLVTLFPKTGRTHQIRVHLAHEKNPVVGDSLYSHNRLEKLNLGMMLFARKLSFLHPLSQKKIEIEIKIPARFTEFESKLENI